MNATCRRLSRFLVIVAEAVLVVVEAVAGGGKDGIPGSVALAVTGLIAGTVVVVARPTRCPGDDIVAFHRMTTFPIKMGGPAHAQQQQRYRL